ncbi:hypothetical protein B0H63DRAFT_472038 [Podospora didyma]|uniref:Uncharacterized protein n=1 Tax=Podospora didyma TaxID=330526 RepID=A0AAE0TZ68_9PEZI|nr:hypothetical protein B0H63DRAFT_472038 [Podospora didyma]
MIMDPASFEDILRAVDQSHEAYVRNLRLLHEAATRVPGSAVRTGGRVDGPPWSPSRAVTFAQDTLQAQAAGFRRRRFTNDLQDPGSMAPPSVSADSGDETEPPPPDRGGRRLLRESFEEHDLALYLKLMDDNADMATALGEAWKKRGDMTALSVIQDLEPEDPSRFVHATCEIYEVGDDGMPEPRPRESSNPDGETDQEVEGDQENECDQDNNADQDDQNHDSGRDQEGWLAIKEVNDDGEAVGRMTILQEPSPLMLGAAHLALKKHFDMDELFQNLISTAKNEGKTKAYMRRAFEQNQLRQRSFFFVFKYYTVVGDGHTPAPWQAFDSRPPDRRSPDHIDITECSSVLALSLGGKSIRNVESKVRRSSGVIKKSGKIYDTFAPWHLLSIQCFPDNEHSVRSKDSHKHCYNGPYAFLDSLRMEYADAVKRYTELNVKITKLITPPSEFMFNVKLRDKLLFEDQHFTYSRRYFWAYNTLGVINEGIKSMRSAYLDTFTREFWAGRHKLLWPHPNPESADGRLYLDRMEVLHQELEATLGELQETYEKNEKTRTEIRSLRDQLFNGSSVKESRRAIEQGDNIKILTGLSMLFLPLTFVTGVFGITQLEIRADDWRFPVTMVSVCIPFFLLIFVLQTRAGLNAVKRWSKSAENYAYRVFLGGITTASGSSVGTGAGSSPGASNADPHQGGDGNRRRVMMRFQRAPKRGVRRTASGLHQFASSSSALGGSSSSGQKKGGGEGGVRFWAWPRNGHWRLLEGWQRGRGQGTNTTERLPRGQKDGSGDTDANLARLEEGRHEAAAK